MKLNVLKALTNLSLVVAFVGAALLLTNTTFGSREFVKYSFLVFGILGIVLNYYLARFVEKDKNFNPIFWIGIFITYLAIVGKIMLLPYYQIVVMIGAGITGLSYFINPASKEDEEEKDQLLDQ